MKKVTLLLFLLVIIGSLPNPYTNNANPVLNQVARAEQIIPTSTDCMARKWEYCSLFLTDYEKSKNGKYTASADICYYQSTGCRRERILSEGYSSDVYLDAKAKAIAKLGDEGWEMFFWTPPPGTYEYYFRRRKM